MTSTVLSFSRLSLRRAAFQTTPSALSLRRTRRPTLRRCCSTTCSTPSRCARSCTGGTASRSPTSPTTRDASLPGALFVCVPGAPSTATSTPPRRSPPAPSRWSASGALEVDVPQVDRRRRAGGDGAAGRPVLRRADPDAARRRRDRHQRQDHDGVRDAGDPRGRRHPRAVCSARSSRSSAASPNRSSGRRPRRSTCSARSGACSTPATAPARWRSRRTRSTCTASTASGSPPRRSPTCSQDHLDFHGSMEEYFAAKARLFDGRCPTRRRTPATRTAAGSTATIRLRRRDGRGARRATSGSSAGGSWFRLVTPAGEVRRADAPARRVQRRQRARGRVAGAPHGACRSRPSPPASASLRRRARPAGAGRGRAAVPGARRLRPHARRAGDRAADGARHHARRG